MSTITSDDSQSERSKKLLDLTQFESSSFWKYRVMCHAFELLMSEITVGRYKIPHSILQLIKISYPIQNALLNITRQEFSDLCTLEITERILSVLMGIQLDGYYLGKISSILSIKHVC